jgi:hypothetical protein
MLMSLTMPLVFSPHPNHESGNSHRKEVKQFIRSTKGLNITKLKINKNEYTYISTQDKCTYKMLH